MNAPTATQPAASSIADWWSRPTETVGQFSAAIAEEYLGRCSLFLRWHREQRVKRDLPAAECAQMDRAHAWLLRTTRALHNLVVDPEFPQPELARRFEGVLWQLQEAWDQVHNPMTEAEASAVIRKHFPPDEPGA